MRVKMMAALKGHRPLAALENRCEGPLVVVLSAFQEWMQHLILTQCPPLRLPLSDLRMQAVRRRMKHRLALKGR